MTPDLILFIDYMNYLHRCRVGNLEGDFVLVFNFFRNLRATIQQFQPAKLFIALDGYPKHRHQIYGEYKANRIIKTASQQETKDKVFQSAEVIKQLLAHVPLTTLFHPDFEADDIIFSMVENIQEEHVVVVSSDADYTQLLQKGFTNCQVYNPIKKVFLENPSYLYVAHKALVGDKSDNIKRLVSDKKALHLIDHPAELSQFMAVEENRANISINRQLIEFAHVPLEEMEIRDGERNFQFLKEAFRQMDFKSLVDNPDVWQKFEETFACLKY